jgi:chromosome segregation ATPase
MATKIEAVSEGSYVSGVTFDPPLHWSEWDTREDGIEESVNGQADADLNKEIESLQSEIDDLQDKAREAESSIDSAVRSLRRLMEKVNLSDAQQEKFEAILDVLNDASIILD